MSTAPKTLKDITLNTPVSNQRPSMVELLWQRGLIDLEALERYRQEHGIERFVTYIAPDFDDPLPEDFLLKPLPEPGPE